MSTFQTEAILSWLKMRDAVVELSAKVANPVRRAMIPDSALSGFDTFVKAAPANVAKFSPSGVLTMRVLNGEKSAAWWQEQAALLQSNIAEVFRYLGDAVPSFQRVVTEIVVPTAAEVKAGVVKVAGTLADLTPWVVAGVIALVGAYLVFTFKR